MRDIGNFVPLILVGVAIWAHYKMGQKTIYITHHRRVPKDEAGPSVPDVVEVQVVNPDLSSAEIEEITYRRYRYGAIKWVSIGAYVVLLLIS